MKCAKEKERRRSGFPVIGLLVLFLVITVVVSTPLSLSKFINSDMTADRARTAEWNPQIHGPATTFEKPITLLTVRSCRDFDHLKQGFPLFIFGMDNSNSEVAASMAINRVLKYQGGYNGLTINHYNDGQSAESACQMEGGILVAAENTVTLQAGPGETANLPADLFPLLGMSWQWVVLEEMRPYDAKGEGYYRMQMHNSDLRYKLQFMNPDLGNINRASSPCDEADPYIVNVASYNSTSYLQWTFTQID